MTQDEVRGAIFLAIIERELVDAHGDPYPAIREVETAKELATSLFNALEAKGLFKLDDEDD